MTKNQAKTLYGWTGGPLDKLAPRLCIGGDRFYNRPNDDGVFPLPEKDGRFWTECDIDTIGANARGAKRIVFSNDGLVYYTSDHYETFTLLYGEP
jgi:guanyl-specific ribonuclease Sa